MHAAQQCLVFPAQSSLAVLVGGEKGERFSTTSERKCFLLAERMTVHLLHSFNLLEATLSGLV